MMQTYEVLLTFQFPAWDEKNGIPFEVVAKNKRDAIRMARVQAERDGHSPCRMKGRNTFRVVK